MSKIKDRIEKLYQKLPNKKVLGVAATMLVSQNVSAALTGQNESLQNDTLQNNSELVKDIPLPQDSIDSEMVRLGDLSLDSLFFSAELLDSLETAKDGKTLARNAKIAQREVNDETHCYRATKMAVKSSGLGELTGEYAYMAADQLAENPNFVEINCDKKDFDCLPDGAIVVYGQGKVYATKDGHTGTVVDHQDVSSKTRNLNKTNTKRDKRTGKRVFYGGEPRVFLPADTLINRSLVSEYEIQQVQNDQSNQSSPLGWEEALKIVQNNQNTY